MVGELHRARRDIAGGLAIREYDGCKQEGMNQNGVTYDVELPCMSRKVECITHEQVGFFVARRIYSPIRRSLPRNLFTHLSYFCFVLFCRSALFACMLAVSCLGLSRLGIGACAASSDTCSTF